MPDKINIACSVALAKILEKMLFITEDGSAKENEIPFNVRYKIQRNLDLLSKDKAYFEVERQRLVKVYGEAKEDDPTRISVKPENVQEFQEEVLKIMALEVEHKFLKFTPEEVSTIKDVNVQAYEMDLFIANLVDDPDREEDLNSPVVPDSAPTTDKDKE